MIMVGRKVLNSNQRLGLGAGAILALFLLCWLVGRYWHPSRSSFPQQGVDLSAAQGKIDWIKAHEDGVDFAYILATDGDADRDPLFSENWQASAAAGVRRGPLHHYNLCRLAADQATNFIATVPREAAELPATLDLDLGNTCTTLPSRSVVVQEVAAFIRAVEAHTEKPVIVRVSRDFEKEFAVSRAIDRPLWLSSFLLTPSYGERPWLIWRANGSRAVSGINTPVSWSVVRP
jgi:lysozyme